MAEASWPFYGVETNEVQFSKWARSLANSGIVRGLQITAGSGMQVIVGTGEGLVRGVFYENNTTSKALTVAAAPATGLTRLDAVVLRLDQTANAITAVVKTGTANNSGGVLPSLTTDETVWELLIGVLTVAAGTAAITTAMIQNLRPSTGLRVYPYVTARRPAAPAEEVALGVDTTTRRLELWFGGSWINLFDFANFTGVVGISQGGTGATTSKGLRQAANIFVQPVAPSHQKGRVWIPGVEMD